MKNAWLKPWAYSTVAPAPESWSALASGTFSMTCTVASCSAVVRAVPSSRMFHSMASAVGLYWPS